MIWIPQSWLCLQGGWRLPGEAFRPENTVQYKDRALQTRFLQHGDLQILEIVLIGDEMSDNLNFVFKVGRPSSHISACRLEQEAYCSVALPKGYVLNDAFV